MVKYIKDLFTHKHKSNKRYTTQEYDVKSNNYSENGGPQTSETVAKIATVTSKDPLCRLVKSKCCVGRPCAQQ